MSQSTRILLALVIGLAGGIALGAFAPAAVPRTLAVAQPVGQAWLNALQMTIVPLVVSLLVTGVAATAEAAQAGRLAGRAIALYVSLLFVSALGAAVLTPLFLHLFPLPQASAASLRAALTGVEAIAPAPPLGEFLANVVPANAVKAAADSAFLSLIVFTLVFAFALTRIEGHARERLVGLFEAVRDAMLVVVGWVLWLAPLGVFALAYLVGARAGSAAFGALVHYMAVICVVGMVVTLVAYLVAAVASRVPVARFARSAAPAQAFAVSTQSSLATLPAMLKAVTDMGVPRAASGVTLPLGVAMFRATQPAMNLAIAIYIGRWFGVEVTPLAVAAAVMVGVVTSLGSISLPSQITFFASVAPIASAMGVPLTPLGLLIAVETIPDIFRTLGNVSSNLALTAIVTRDQVSEPVTGPRASTS
jgi:proton glutamate symport protein